MKRRHMCLVALLHLWLMAPESHVQGTPFLPSNLEPIIADNAARMEQLGIIGFGLIEDIAWSPNGETVAVAGSLGVTFYDAEVFDTAPYHRLAIPEEHTRAIAYSPDGTLVATVSGARLRSESDTFVFRLWNVVTETIVAAWQVEYSAFDVPIAFSPDGKQLAIARHYYDFRRQQPGLNPVWDISEPSNIQQLAPITWNDLMREWYVQEDTAFFPSEDAWLVSYSPNGRLAAYLDDQIYLVDTATGDSIYTFQHDSMTIDDIYFTSDSQYLVSREASEAGAGQIRTWNTETGNETLSYDSGYLGAIAFHPMQPAILFSSWGDGLQYWQAGDATPHFVLGQFWSTNQYFDVAFNPTGDTIAAAHGRAIELWDVGSGTRQAEIYRVTDNPYAIIYYTEIAYNPNGTLLAAFDTDGLLHLYDTETLEELASIQHPRGYYTELDVAFSPDGTLLATYSAVDSDIAPTAVFLWDVDTLINEHELEIGQELARIFFFNVQGIINQAVFSPDGEMLAITGYGTEIWNIEEVLHWRVVGHAEDMHPSVMMSVSEQLGATAGPLAFSSDGELLATGSNGIPCDIAIWDLETAVITTCIAQADRPIQSVIFTPDNTLLITGADLPFDRDARDTAIHLWDVSTAESLAVLEGHFEQINRITLSPDGTLIASAGGGITCEECPSFDGTIRLWGVVSEQSK